MAEIIPFRKPPLKHKHRGNTLCRHGHHRWEVVSHKPFDVKQGRLVTLLRCSRCGREKTEAR